MIGFATEPQLIFFKYYPLGNLNNKKYRQQKISSVKTLRLIIGVGEAIAVMHQEGFAHCDIKPDNILLEEVNGEIIPVLTDLGISRVVRHDILKVKEFKTVNVRGISAAYASPELWNIYLRRIVDLRSIEEILAGDIYAFGCVVFELVNNVKPWHKPRIDDAGKKEGKVEK